MNTWFTSDIHWGHSNILFKFCPETRQGEDINEMNRIIIRNWQNVVQPNDTVWLLGDIFFIKDENVAANILSQLPGRISLCYGNHDKLIRKSKRLQDYFESVQEWAEINVDGKQMILHHYPTYEWKNMHRGAYHGYGHIHSRYGKTPHPHIPGRCIDLGIDSRPNKDMTLWSWKEVDSILSKREIRGHHDTEL